MCNISKLYFYFTVNIGKMLTIIIHLICHNNFIKCFLKYLNICFPKICFRSSTNGKKWITPAIKQACLTKNKLYKRYLNIAQMSIYRNTNSTVIGLLLSFVQPKKRILMSYLCTAIITLKIHGKILIRLSVIIIDMQIYMNLGKAILA